MGNQNTTVSSMIQLEWLQEQCVKRTSEVLSTDDTVRGDLTGMVQSRDRKMIEIGLIFCTKSSAILLTVKVPVGTNDIGHSFQVHEGNTIINVNLDHVAGLQDKINHCIGRFNTCLVPNRWIGYSPFYEVTSAKSRTHYYFPSNGRFLCEFEKASWMRDPPTKFVCYRVDRSTATVAYTYEIFYGQAVHVTATLLDEYSQSHSLPYATLTYHGRNFSMQQDYMSLTGALLSGKPGLTGLNQLSTLLRLDQPIPDEANSESFNLPYCLWSSEQISKTEAWKQEVRRQSEQALNEHLRLRLDLNDDQSVKK